MAACSDPDTDSSPGADFLRSIETSVKDALNTIDADSGDMDEWSMERAHEIADYCIPAYTHALWSTFVDLAAYSEDVSERGMESVPMDELTKLPSVALFMIGERLALALFSDETSDTEGEE
jgi:hypothetical protein